MRKIRRVDANSMDEPPMAPFIDVTFQLLIFFMLTLKFKTVEGNLLALLPREKGLPATMRVDLPNEIRVNVCSHPGRRFDQHLGAKETHQHDLRALRRGGTEVGEISWVWLERDALAGRECFELYRTDRHPSKAAHNRDVYQRIADRVLAMLPATHSHDKPPSVVLDLDGLTPYEHALSLFAAIQRRGILDLRWAGNPRFDRYFGPDR